MASRSSFKKAGRGMLMGVAVSTLPLAGCAEFSLPPKEIWVSAEEKHFYDRARASGDPSQVSRFMKRFPESELIRLLLNSLPPADLQRISPSAVAAVDPEVLASLPRDVRKQLGIAVTPVYSPPESDGY